MKQLVLIICLAIVTFQAKAYTSYRTYSDVYQISVGGAEANHLYRSMTAEEKRLGRTIYKEAQFKNLYINCGLDAGCTIKIKGGLNVTEYADGKGVVASFKTGIASKFLAIGQEYETIDDNLYIEQTAEELKINFFSN